MDINQVLLVLIVILIGVMLVFGFYFLIIFIKSKTDKKKKDKIFNPNNLVEENSLLNVLDKKTNKEDKIETIKNNNTFINDKELVNNNVSPKTNYEKTNPFNVNLDRGKSNMNNEENEDGRNKNNKFFN